jgi:outer membrane protein OmpA-like peptidoglycan-associated protein
MKTEFWLLCCLLALFLTSGCASHKNMVVLLPDNDGHVGEVQISNRAGMQTITQAWQVSRVKSGDAPPEVAVAIEEKEVEKVFGAALKALPEPPIRYVLHFKVESTELLADSKKIIPEVVSQISARHSRDIGISGHTDSVGTDAFNMDLSNRRAVYIKGILVSQGVKPDDIELNYYGKRNPLIHVGDNVPEPRNRRVEIHIR